MGRLQVRKDGRETVIDVPAPGFNRITPLWLFGAGVAAWLCGDLLRNAPSESLLAVLGLLAIVAFCSVNLLVSLRASTRMTITEGSLSIRQQRLVGSRVWTWRHGEITDVHPALSHLSVNRQRLPHLVVATRSGPVTLFLGWPEKELEFMAGEILQALRK